MKLNKKTIKNKNYRQLAVVLSFLLTAIAGIWSLGYQNIYDALLQYQNGKDSHYYLTKDWVTSEYGYPVIQITTPEVLERTTSDHVDFRAQASALFKWNSVQDKVAISVETKAYKDTTKFQLVEIINSEEAVLLQQGIKNLKVDAKNLKIKMALKGTN